MVREPMIMCSWRSMSLVSLLSSRIQSQPHLVQRKSPRGNSPGEPRNEAQRPSREEGGSPGGDKLTHLANRP